MLFARSDVMAVAVPVKDGGCGETHSRPVEDGAPVKFWKLTCAPCENYLRDDPLWAPFEAKIPETPDEEAQREEWEKRTQGEREAHQADAFQKLADATYGNSAAMNKLVELIALMNPEPAPAKPAARRPATRSPRS